MWNEEIVFNLTVLFMNLSKWAANLEIVGAPAETETTFRLQVRRFTT